MTNNAHVVCSVQVASCAKADATSPPTAATDYSLSANEQQQLERSPCAMAGVTCAIACPIPAHMINPVSR